MRRTLTDRLDPARPGPTPFGMDGLGGGEEGKRKGGEGGVEEGKGVWGRRGTLTRKGGEESEEEGKGKRRKGVRRKAGLMRKGRLKRR